jgi:hypothetical protein
MEWEVVNVNSEYPTPIACSPPCCDQCAEAICIDMGGVIGTTG